MTAGHGSLRLFRPRTGCRRYPRLCRQPGASVTVLEHTGHVAQLNRDTFVVNDAETTVRLHEHRGDFDLSDLELGAEDGNAA